MLKIRPDSGQYTNSHLTDLPDLRVLRLSDETTAYHRFHAATRYLHD